MNKAFIILEQMCLDAALVSDHSRLYSIALFIHIGLGASKNLVKYDKNENLLPICCKIPTNFPQSIGHILMSSEIPFQLGVKS